MTPLRHAADRARIVRTPDGAELRTHIRGPERAPVAAVLAHGWMQASDTWRLQAARLASAGDDAVRTVRWDGRGHGGSTPGTRPIANAALGDDLLRVLQDCAPEGPVVLAGHSMGGRAIMALAAAHPELFGERVAGVLLVATAAGRLETTGPGHTVGARMAGGARLAAMRSLRRVPAAVDRLRALLPPRSAAYRAAVRRVAFGAAADPVRVRECAELIHGTPTEVAAGFYETLAAEDLSGGLAALREVPVRILAGGRDRLIGRGGTRALARALPHARLRVLPGRGHMLPLEAPEAVGDELAEMCRAAARRPGGD
ncbi:alpha/beta fold hydrolase [Streptomonospora litoralis]|uniref:alpha/beta fold hydrolase n=1 Tax=Streptomonospora litoralis TaxID=2498135 RepID=UPI00103616CB|nr:alpha/beta hydrolase [Streptomonospora litoralis]